MPKLDISSHKIGELTVYAEQVRCSEKIISMFERMGGPPVLVAQMQQGKTGTCICVIEKFIKNCELHGHKYEIIYLTNIGDNNLKGQTESRLLIAGLSSKVKNLHLSDLQEGRFVPDETVDRRLIIIDECHLALEKSTPQSLKPFHEFTKNCGLKYGSPISTWGNKYNFVLSVSATPYAHLIVAALDDKKFESVTLEVSPDYYSLQHMNEAGRIKKSEPTVVNGKVTPFFKERMKEFLSECQKSSPGHLVVRSIGSNPETLSNFIRNNHPEVDVKIYESKPINNIQSLDGDLSQKLPRPFVAIIRGSLRAGKTLITTKHIKMWIEPPASKTDTVAQAVGRCLGFEMEDGINRRFQDSFPVYCNTREMEIAIDFYNKYECIPSGVGNKSNTTITMECEVQVLPEQTENEVRRIHNAAISRCSEAKINDYADDILNKRLRGYSKDGSKKRVYYMNGPSKNKAFAHSWLILSQQMPEVIGKYVLISPTGRSKVKVVDNNSNLLDPKRIPTS